MSEQIERATLNVLSSSRLLTAHPGDMSLAGGKYPSEANCTTDLAQSLNSRGLLRVAGNSKSLPGLSNYDITASALVSDLKLYVTVTPAANVLVSEHGWLFSLIDYFEVTFSNSLLQSIRIDAYILRDWLLMQCGSEKVRQQLLIAAGDPFEGDGATEYAACIPLAFLNFGLRSGGVNKTNFPLDMSAFGGSMRIAVSFKAFTAISCKKNAQSPTFPSALVTNEIVAQTSFLMNEAFSVRSSMMALPDLRYNLPATYMQCSRYTQTGLSAFSDRFVMNVQSAPSGMLEYLIIFATVSTREGDSAGTNVPRHQSLPLVYCELEYSGQSIIRYEEGVIMKSFNTSAFGDTLEYENYQIVDNSGAGVANRLCERSVVNCLPLGFDMQDIVRGGLRESLANYSSANLQLTLEFGSPDKRLIASPFGLELVTVGASTTVNLYFGWAVAGILTITGQTIDLQL